MDIALKVGWCADVLSKCGALQPYDNNVTAQISMHHMNNNKWCEAADIILHGLAHGFPSAAIFAHPMYTFVDHACDLHFQATAVDQTQTRHRLDDLVTPHLRVAAKALILQAIHVR